MGRKKSRKWLALMLAGLAIWGLGKSGTWDGLGETLLAQAGQWQLADKALRFQLGLTQEAGNALGASALLRSACLQENEAEELGDVIPIAAMEEVTEAELTPELAEDTAEPVAEPSENPERTLSTATGSGAINLDGISLNNKAGVSVDLEAVAELVPEVTLSDSGPQILIMHTHATEAYTQDGTDCYTASDTYRTTDEEYNMLRVGEEIKAVLEEAGYSVLHDTELYDYPNYTGSYARARAGIQAYLEEYPTISLVLDVHRDALIDSDGTSYKVVTTVDGEKTAQVMLVMGTDAGGLEHPNWRGNLAFALQVQQAMLSIDTTFPRPINLRSSRFNQDMTSLSMLVEVGSCGNTLQEAIRGGRLFARSLAEALGGLE